MLKLYRLVENPRFFFIADIPEPQTLGKFVVLESGTYFEMQEFLLSLGINLESEEISGDTYLRWLKATLF